MITSKFCIHILHCFDLSYFVFNFVFSIAIGEIEENEKVELQIYPSKDLIHSGDNIDVRCTVLGDSTAPISWTKVGSQMPNNVRTIGDTLR